MYFEFVAHSKRSFRKRNLWCLIILKQRFHIHFTLTLDSSKLFCDWYLITDLFFTAIAWKILSFQSPLWKTFSRFFLDWSSYLLIIFCHPLKCPLWGVFLHRAVPPTYLDQKLKQNLPNVLNYYPSRVWHIPKPCLYAKELNTMHLFFFQISFKI